MLATRRNQWPNFGGQIPSIKVIVCLALIATEVRVGINGEPTLVRWGSSCREPCTCEMSPFSELPLATRLLSPRPSQANQSSQSNEATYDSDTTPLQGEQLKMAVCVLLANVDANDLLFSLPVDLQALTLLQGRGAGHMSLEAEALAHFSALEVLDIQGFPASSDRLTISSHALAQQPTLRYFNAEFLSLVPDKEIENEINARPPGSSRLVFLEPAGNDLPLVSFTEFKQRRQAKPHDQLFSFTSLPSLKYLRVHGCNLRELEWEMFRGLAQLESLSLENNNLLFIPEFVFYGTPALKSLSLAGNQLLGLRDTALAGLFYLETLDLSSNNFSHLSELSLPPFPELRTADFRSNPVTAIYPSTFEIMNATAQLFLGGAATPLTLLSNSFLGLSSLRWLAVENVRVPKLETDLLRGMPQLVELDMTGNIASIAFDAFLHVPNLRRLSLKRCAIAHISMDAFYGLRSLVELDLSENSLTALPPGIFDQQINIEDILLKDNQLTTLPAELFSHLPAKMIRLDGNPWHCSCEMRGWKAVVINKVKGGERAIAPVAACAGIEGKGTVCPKATSHVSKYSFDKKVAPRCATPAKYRDWNIFHLLRKQLRCGRVAREDKIYKSDYIQRKHAAYYDSLKTVRPDSAAGIDSSGNATVAFHSKKLHVTTEPALLASENTKNREGTISSGDKKMTASNKDTTSSPILDIGNFSFTQQQEKINGEKEIQPEIVKKTSTSPSGTENIHLKHKKEKPLYADKRKMLSQGYFSKDEVSSIQKEDNKKESKDIVNTLEPHSFLNNENIVPKGKDDTKNDNRAENADKSKEDAKLFKKSWKLDAEKKRAEKLSRMRV